MIEVINKDLFVQKFGTAAQEAIGQFEKDLALLVAVRIYGVDPDLKNRLDTWHKRAEKL